MHHSAVSYNGLLPLTAAGQQMVLFVERFTSLDVQWSVFTGTHPLIGNVCVVSQMTALFLLIMTPRLAAPSLALAHIAVFSPHAAVVSFIGV